MLMIPDIYGIADPHAWYYLGIERGGKTTDGYISERGLVACMLVI